MASTMTTSMTTATHTANPPTTPKRPRRPVAAAPDVLGLIGDTPLVRLNHYLQHDDVELFAKLECFNPGGSAKDRPALRMLEDAVLRGLIDRQSTIVESSSGNMGIGLAQACRFFRLPFICVVDPHAQPQNLAIMRALGARVDRVNEKLDGSFLAARLDRVQQYLKTVPGSYWPNQYANRQNPSAHETGTIQEIDAATGGDFDYLFVATSSTGTAQGCRDYLRKRGHHATVVAVDAVGSVLFGGSPGQRLIPGLGAGQEPALARDQTFDLIQRVTDGDCVVGCRRAAQLEALLIGGSAGGVLEVVRRMADSLVGSRCVAILHDSGTRYIDTVFNDHWVADVLGLDSGLLQQCVEGKQHLCGYEGGQLP